VALERLRERLLAFHAELDSVVLDGGGRRLRDARALSQFVLAQSLQLTDDSHRAARDIAAGLWSQLILMVLLGTLLLCGSLSAFSEGRLGAAFVSITMGAGLLLLVPALWADDSAGALLGVAGALLGLIGCVFLAGMKVGETEPLRPIEVRVTPWAAAIAEESPLAAGRDMLHAPTVRVDGIFSHREVDEM